MNKRMNASKQKSSDMPFVVAVVLNYNGYEDTVKCMCSLQDVSYPNLKIVLVDNGSPDNSGDRLKSDFPDIHMIILKENTGYAAGNNVGIKYALEQQAEYVLVINNDVIVDSGFLEPMVDVAEKKPDVGIVTCKVYYQSAPQEIFSAVGKMNWLLCTGVNKGSHLKSLQKTDAECFTDFACGVLLLMRAKMLKTEGLFDDKYFMYFEDVEFSRRILRSYKIAYTPQGIAYHKSGGGKGWRTYSELYLYYHTRNRFWAFCDDPLFYRIYVFLFSLMNVLIKTFFISLNIISDRKRMVQQLLSLWKGFRDGAFRN
jgi:GT2 family glycosyltransferase